MIKYILILIFFSLLTSENARAYSDSLWKVWKNTTLNDTIRLKALQTYAWDKHLNSNPDSLITLSKIQLNYAANKGLKEYMASAYNSIGVANYYLGNLDLAIENYEKSYFYYKSIKDKNAMSTSLCNKAIIYIDQSNYQPALKTYFMALKIFEETKDSLKIAIVYNNIAIIYDNQKLYDLSIEYYTKSLKIKKAQKDKLGIAATLTNIGALNAALKNVAKAQSLYEEALVIYQKENSKSGMALIYANQSELYNDVPGKEEQVLNLRLKALKLYRELKDNSNSAKQEIGLGKYYLSEGDIVLAEKYLKKALKFFSESGEISKASEASKHLYLLFAGKKDFKQALTYFEMTQELKDSTRAIEALDETLRLKYDYEYTKKALEDSIAFQQKEELNLLKLREQEALIEKGRTQKYALYGGILALLVFGGFAFRTYQRKKNDHEVISLQHTKLAQNHLEIKQSIDYAKRLQDAFLPSTQQLKTYFDEYFILFKPKDVVSGDFYWFEYDEATDTKIMAIADCTGHGVPGALVSIVCSNALNKVVKEMQITNPAEILNKTREIVIETFTKAGNDLRDGMDITICAIKNSSITFAGANNGIWLVEQGSTDLQEFKVDRQSVGWQEVLKPFHQQEIKVKKGDTIYMTTDGFPDQFGGSQGKKYKKLALKTFVSSIQSHNLPDQETILSEEFERWKGSLDQVDDVCMMAIRF